MTQQKEIAFLTALMSHEDEEMVESACPEPSILWSLTQRDSKESDMVKELRTHVASCRSCADLSRRLTAFHHEAYEQPVSAQDNGWAETKPRLNKWVGKFLKSQPKRGGETSWWRLPGVSWGMQLAVASCAICLIVSGVVWEMHDSGSRGGFVNDISLVPTQRSADQIASRPSTGSNSVLMKDHREAEAGTSDGEEMDAIALSTGEHMKLLVTMVDRSDGGNYKLDGKLMPVTPDVRSSYTVVVTAILSNTVSNGLDISIVDATKNNKIYRIAMGENDTLLAALTAEASKNAPHAGQIFDLTISSGRVLLRPEP